MAKNTGLKRTVYRYVRDGVKSNYVYGECCEICGTVDDLELHHPTTLSLLFDKYCKENDLTVTTKEEVMEVREDFYKAHWNEVVTDVMTLCNTHHKALHKIYGSQPPLSSASKQKEWALRLKDRPTNKDVHSSASGFSQFIPGRVPAFSEFCL